MPAKFIGAHMPAPGGPAQAVLDGHQIGCTAIQVFTSSPRTWQASPATQEKVKAMHRAIEKTGIQALISHDSYLINLADMEEERWLKSRNALKAEMVRCGEYNIPYVVTHMGSHHGIGVEAGLERVSETALQILDETPDSVTLLMETTAGQGTALNCTFEQIAKVLDLTKAPKRLGVCLDTCHIFVAGYDIRTDEGFSLTFEHFENLIGFDRLKAVHCNDSKKGLGSHVDRHENLGEGMIGPRAFELLVTDKRFEEIPIVVETPTEDDGHAKNVAKLWAWASGT